MKNSSINSLPHFHVINVYQLDNHTFKIKTILAHQLSSLASTNNYTPHLQPIKTTFFYGLLCCDSYRIFSASTAQTNTAITQLLHWKQLPDSQQQQSTTPSTTTNTNLYQHTNNQQQCHQSVKISTHIPMATMMIVKNNV